MGERPEPGISIIVPTYNSVATIEACLRGVTTAPPATACEVIVVDNGSTDNTLAIVRRFPVALHEIPRGFVSGSRNAGARFARYGFLAFVDSDCVVQPGWHEAVARVLDDRSVGIAGCRYALRDGASWVERAWDRAHSGDSGGIESEVRYVPGGNMAIRRDRFVEAGGFDETLETGEDMDLGARLAARGHRIVEARTFRCVHLGEPRTLRAVFRRNRWHGRGTRFRYADGQVAAIALATVTFGGLLVLGTMAFAGGVLLGRPALAFLGALTAVVIPAIYAGRYARRPRLPHGVQLWAIYGAYFLGRAVALPVALRRQWGGASGPAHASHRHP